MMSLSLKIRFGSENTHDLANHVEITYTSNMHMHTCMCDKLEREKMHVRKVGEGEDTCMCEKLER